MVFWASKNRNPNRRSPLISTIVCIFSPKKKKKYNGVCVCVYSYSYIKLIFYESLYYIKQQQPNNFVSQVEQLRTQILVKKVQ